MHSHSGTIKKHKHSNGVNVLRRAFCCNTAWNVIKTQNKLTRNGKFRLYFNFYFIFGSKLKQCQGDYLNVWFSFFLSHISDVFFGWKVVQVSIIQNTLRSGYISYETWWRPKFHSQLPKFNRNVWNGFFDFQSKFLSTFSLKFNLANSWSIEM